MNNKTILLTGGTGKVGSQLIKHFSERGYNVVFTSRYKDKIDNIIKNTSNNNIYGIEIDLTEENSVKRLLEELKIRGLNPEYLINNARCLDYLKVESDGFSKRENIINEYILDVVVPYELSFCLAKQENSNLKKIINISSIYGVVPFNPTIYKNPEIDTPIQYSIAKSALIHLTKELAVRFAKNNIQVNAISYGGINGRVDNEFREKYAKFCPLGRMLEEKEIVGAVEFLISDNSVYMTGQNLIIDGGWTLC